MGVGGQRQAPAALPPWKAPYPLHRRLGGPQSRSGQVRKISPPTGIRSPERPARSEQLYRLGNHSKLIFRIHTCVPVHLVRHLCYRVFVVCDVLTAVDMTRAALRDVNTSDNAGTYGRLFAY
jgi:hypothetical protein